MMFPDYCLFGLSADIVSDMPLKVAFSLFCVVSLFLGALRAGEGGTAIPVASAARNDAIEITTLTAAPHPAVPGRPVIISAALKVAHGAAPSGFMDFGDSTAPFTFAAGDVVSLSAVEHTFAVPGVYGVRLYTSTSSSFSEAYLFIVVGRECTCSPYHGIHIMATDAAGNARGGAASRYAGGKVRLMSDASLLHAMRVVTEFQDISGHSETVTGSDVGHTYTKRGIYVATITAQDDAGATLGNGRRMFTISDGDVGDSAALPDPPSSAITIKKMQGKFAFASSSSDKLSFSGSVKLPAGFALAPSGGLEISVGIGAITDTVAVDAKGRAILPSVKNIIKRLKLRCPQFPQGVSSGGETAQIDVSFTLPDMDVAGLDTDGIRSRVRNDERTLKAVDRNVQIGVLLGGVPYESYAPVSFQLSRLKPGATTAEAGQFKGVPGRAVQAP
jgi:hypothetical protein